MTHPQLPHAVVIGGTSGIGLATADRLLRDGYRVTIAGRDKTRLETALAELAGPGGHGGADTVTGASLDAADRDAAGAFFAGLGPVDHLVVTATAPAGMAPVADLAAGRLRDAFDGKLLAHLNCVQAALPVLAPAGSVVLVSAASARGGLPGTAGLAAVNGAIEAMIKPLAVELAPRRVNAVSPGFVDTPWWDWLPQEARQAAFAQAAAVTPVGRVGQAQDIADAIAFLLRNTFTTGVVLACDGGALLRPAG